MKSTAVSTPVPNDAKMQRVAALLAANPPRNVTPEMRKLALRQGFSRFVMIFGALFGTFGLVFVYLFFPWNFPDEMRLGSSDAASAQGRVIHTESTNMSINKTRVMRVTYAFLPQGKDKSQEGVCFTTGSRWSTGATVTVRYLRDKPEVSCAVGGRLSEGSWFGAITLVFPLVGFGLVYTGKRQRANVLRTLRHGVTTEARVSAIEPTRTQVNKQTVYRISLARSDKPSAPPLVIKRYQRELLDRLRNIQKQDQPMYVLVDPARPKVVLLPEIW